MESGEEHICILLAGYNATVAEERALSCGGVQAVLSDLDPMQEPQYTPMIEDASFAGRRQGTVPPQTSPPATCSRMWCSSVGCARPVEMCHGKPARWETQRLYDCDAANC